MNHHSDAYWHPSYMPSRQDVIRDGELVDEMNSLDIGQKEHTTQEGEDEEMKEDHDEQENLEENQVDETSNAFEEEKSFVDDFVSHENDESDPMNANRQQIDPETTHRNDPEIQETNDTEMQEDENVDFSRKNDQSGLFQSEEYDNRGVKQRGSSIELSPSQLSSSHDNWLNEEQIQENVWPNDEIKDESYAFKSNENQTSNEASASLNLDETPAELSFHADEHPIVDRTVHETPDNTFVHYTVNKSLESSPVKHNVSTNHGRQLSVFANYEENDDFFASIDSSRSNNKSPKRSSVSHNKRMSIFANSGADDSFFESLKEESSTEVTTGRDVDTGLSFNDNGRKYSFFDDIAGEVDKNMDSEVKTEEKTDDIFGDSKEDDIFMKLSQQSESAESSTGNAGPTIGETGSSIGNAGTSIQNAGPSIQDTGSSTNVSKTQPAVEAFSFLEDDEDLLPDDNEEPASGNSSTTLQQSNNPQNSYQPVQQSQYQPVQQPSYQPVQQTHTLNQQQSAPMLNQHQYGQKSHTPAQSGYSNTASIYQPVQNNDSTSSFGAQNTYHNPYSAPPQAVYQSSYLDKKPKSNAFDLPTNIVPKSVVRPSASMQTITPSNAYFPQGPSAPTSQYAPTSGIPRPPSAHGPTSAYGAPSHAPPTSSHAVPPSTHAMSASKPHKELTKSKSFFEELPITNRRAPVRRSSAATMIPPELPEAGPYAYGRNAASPVQPYAQNNAPPPPPTAPPTSFQNPYAPRTSADENRMPNRTRSSSLAQSTGRLSPEAQLRSPYVPARAQIAATPPPAAAGYAPSVPKPANPYAARKPKTAGKPAPYAPDAAPLGDLPLDISRQSSMGNTAYKYQSAHPYGNMTEHAHFDKVSPDSFPTSSTPVDNEALLRRQFPIFHWGGGGRVVYLIPTVVSYGAAQGQSQITVSTVQKVLKGEEYTLFGKFPGPLVTSRGPIKGKKKELEKWIEEKIAFVQKHLSSSQSEDRLIMWQFLQILVKSESHISKMKQEDLEKIAHLLNPRAGSKHSTDAYQSPGHHRRASSLESAGFLGAHGRNGTGKAYREDIRAIYSCMETGDRSAALQLCLDRNHWAHALIIASSLGPEVWNQVVADFVATAVEPVDGGYSRGLSFMYQICSGAGERAVSAIYPPKTMSANFAQDDAHYTSQVVQSLADWKNYLSFMLLNQSPNVNDAILGLGKMLLQHGYVEAGHICVILSGVPSFGSPEETGITLVGSDSRWTPSATGRDEDSILLSEIYEFVLLSNAPTTITPSPHLVLYKLQHAILLADHGLMQAADKQIESVAALVKANTKAKFSPDLLAQLENTHKWISVESGSNTSGWFSSKKLDKTIIQSFNKFVAGDDNVQSGSDGLTSDNSVFKRIASTPGPQIPSHSAHTSPYNGSTVHVNPPTEAPQLSRAQSMGVLPQMSGRPTPFQHSSYFAPSNSTPYGYEPVNGSIIAPDTPGSSSSNGNANTSRPVTPQTNNGYTFPSPSGTNLSRPASSQQIGSRQLGKRNAYGNAAYADSTPSLNSGSGESVGVSDPYAPSSKPKLNRSQTNPYAPMSESHSQYSTTSSSDYLSASQSQNPYGSMYGSDDRYDSASPQTAVEPPAGEERPRNDDYMYGENTETENVEDMPYDDIEGGGATSYTNESYSSAPQTNYAPTSSYSSYDASATTIPEEDEEPEDLGIANKRREEPKKQEPEKENKEEGKGWFGWLRKGSTDEKPKAIRAKLGEQSAFYYDKDLKRWVNKNAPLEDQKPAAAPPPPKASSMASSKPGTPLGSGTSSSGPPSRVPSGPPGGPPKIPTSGTSSPAPPSTNKPIGSGGLDELLAAPPTTGSRKGNRKNARNRYVDIMADK